MHLFPCAGWEEGKGREDTPPAPGCGPAGARGEVGGSAMYWADAVSQCQLRIQCGKACAPRLFPEPTQQQNLRGALHHSACGGSWGHTHLPSSTRLSQGLARHRHTQPQRWAMKGMEKPLQNVPLPRAQPDPIRIWHPYGQRAWTVGWGRG